MSCPYCGERRYRELEYCYSCAYALRVLLPRKRPQGSRRIIGQIPGVLPSYPGGFSIGGANGTGRKR